MAYDGNGTFLPLPAPTFPAQPGTVIYAEYFNANLLNIIQGLTAALPRNGEAAMAGPLRMAGFKLTELGAGSSAGEAVEWGQWQNSYLNATYQVLNVPNLGLTPDGTRVTNVNWVDGQFSARFPNLSAPVLANATEINYLIGLTGDIQPQLSNQVAGPIHAATAKTTPTDADELGITDSAASWELKKLTFADLKTWLSGLYAGKTGAGASGTWAIAISGNAATATSSNSASAAWVSAPINSSVAQSTPGSSAEIRNSSGSGDAAVAALAFHCQGTYRTKLHLRHDGYFGLGGDSRVAWGWYVDGANNMTASGNVTAYSDPRLKENFKRIDDPMTILSKLDGGSFNWRHGFPHIECKAGKRDYGVLADQVQAVMPEIVTNSIDIEGETYLTVAYDKLVPVLIEAVKQLEQRIKELEAK